MRHSSEAPPICTREKHGSIQIAKGACGLQCCLHDPQRMIYCITRDQRPSTKGHDGISNELVDEAIMRDEGVHFIQKSFSLKDLAAKIRETLDCQ